MVLTKIIVTLVQQWALSNFLMVMWLLFQVWQSQSFIRVCKSELANIQFADNFYFNIAHMPNTYNAPVKAFMNSFWASLNGFDRSDDMDFTRCHIM